MGEVLCSTENSPFLIIDHIHAKINRVCCAALAIGKRCMNVRKNKLFIFILAGNKDVHESLDELKFPPDTTTNLELSAVARLKS